MFGKVIWNLKVDASETLIKTNTTCSCFVTPS